MPRKSANYHGKGHAMAIFRHLTVNHKRRYSRGLGTMLGVMKEEHTSRHLYGELWERTHKESDLMDGKFGSSRGSPG